MRLMHNLASLNVYYAQNKNIKAQTKASQRISSGVKFTNSKENPNGIAKSERIRMQIKGLQVAQQNNQDGVSMLQAAEGGVNELTSMVQRVRELVVQSGGATTSDDRNAIQNEITQMNQGIDNLVNSTEFNGVKLIGDTAVTSNNNPNYLLVAVGANTGDTAKIPTYNLSSSTLGDTVNGQYLSSIDIRVPGNIDKALGIVDSALSTISDINTKYGALENRFDTEYNYLDEINLKLNDSDSQLRDADIATEMSDYSRAGILIDAGNAIMAQTNRLPQDILKILENVR